VQELRVTATGHPNIRSTHTTTWQLTTEDHLTPRGDCIIGVNASMGARDLPKWLQDHLQSGGRISYLIRVGDLEARGQAMGHPDLTLEDPLDMVFRKSSYTSARTVAISSSLVARDLPKEMVRQLQQGADLELVIRTESE
jgi:hypothetical protein